MCQTLLGLHYSTQNNVSDIAGLHNSAQKNVLDIVKVTLKYTEECVRHCWGYIIVHRRMCRTLLGLHSSTQKNVSDIVKVTL